MRWLILIIYFFILCGFSRCSLKTITHHADFTYGQGKGEAEVYNFEAEQHIEHWRINVGTSLMYQWNPKEGGETDE